MKKLCITILVVLMAWATGQAQSCLPQGINFTYQWQVDSFAVNYPGCQVIEGDVIIKQSSITNLVGLNPIDSIGGSVTIENNPYLYSLNGLDNLVYINGTLRLHNNDYFGSLNGLSGLTVIGGDLSIYNNDKLDNVGGLGDLTKIGGGLTVVRNSSLDNFLGL